MFWLKTSHLQAVTKFIKGNKLPYCLKMARLQPKPVAVLLKKIVVLD
jgi:hypothetical protein